MFQIWHISMHCLSAVYIQLLHVIKHEALSITSYIYAHSKLDHKDLTMIFSYHGILIMSC